MFQSQTYGKLNIEEIPEKLMKFYEDNKQYGTGYEEMYLSSPIRIDIDAGNSEKGKTKELIPGIVGWVTSLGWRAAIKPYSTAASSIADKYSKKSA